MLLHKMSPYDESTKVPLYIAGPGSHLTSLRSLEGFSKGKVVDDLVLLTDIAPTVLDMAGLEIPEYFDSFSLLSKKKRDLIYMQYKEEEDPMSHTMTAHENETVAAAVKCPDGFAQDPASWKALRTHNLLFICYYMLSYKSYDTQTIADLENFTADMVDLSKLEKECELYDLKNDPHQMNNLIKQVDNATKNKLDETLIALSKCSGKACYEVKLNVKLP